MADKIAKIGKNLVKSVTTGQYCRLSARELSSLKPQLDAHRVRMIGIGLEELGVEEFVQGKFFDGELYIDTKKQCYKDMQYNRLSLFAVLRQLFTKLARDRYSESKKLGGDLKGDGLQNGGTLVVEKGGKVLLNFVQTNVAEHVEPSDVLKALGISPPEQGASADQGAAGAAAAGAAAAGAAN